MGSALVWGALAASSLVIGALLGLARRWPDKWVGLVLAFGARFYMFKRFVFRGPAPEPDPAVSPA